MSPFTKAYAGTVLTSPVRGEVRNMENVGPQPWQQTPYSRYKPTGPDSYLYRLPRLLSTESSQLDIWASKVHVLKNTDICPTLKPYQPSRPLQVFPVNKDCGSESAFHPLHTLRIQLADPVLSGCTTPFRPNFHPRAPRWPVSRHLTYQASVCTPPVGRPPPHRPNEQILLCNRSSERQQSRRPSCQSRLDHRQVYQQEAEAQKRIRARVSPCVASAITSTADTANHRSSQPSGLA